MLGESVRRLFIFLPSVLQILTQRPYTARWPLSKRGRAERVPTVKRLKGIAIIMALIRVFRTFTPTLSFHKQYGDNVTAAFQAEAQFSPAISSSSAVRGKIKASDGGRAAIDRERNEGRGVGGVV